MLNKLVLLIRKHRIFIGFFTYSIFCWSWLLEVDVATLASSSLVGRLVQTTVLIAITLLSATIYTKSLKWLFASLKKSINWATPLKLVMWWAATEFFVSWAVSIIWYGEGARFDNILPFTSLSHLAIWTPLGYLSRFVGFYGLSGVVFLILTTVFISTLRKFLLPVLVVTATATFFAWAIYRVPNGPSANIVVVTEKVRYDWSSTVFDAEEGNLVIFPEYSFSDIDDESLDEKVRSRETNNKVFFVSSRYVYVNKRLSNQLVAGDTVSGITHKINKSRLIPGGEHLSYTAVGLLRAAGAGEVVDKFKETRQIHWADGAKQMLINFGEIKVGAGVCSSIIAPEDYRKLARNGANIFTNSAALGLFQGSKIYGLVHMSKAKFMATANARTLLQSANNGFSFGFDTNGKLLFENEETGQTKLSVDLNSKRTIYSLFGEYLGLGGFVWMAITLIMQKYRDNQSTS